MADVLETIKAMVRQGASSDEIVDTLKSMGIPEDEARKLILLAERDMLRVLRNEIREIAADAFDEKAEAMKKDLAADVNRIVDTQMKLTKKLLFDSVREELNRYVSTISRLEDRLSVLERKVYDIETRLGDLESSYRPQKHSKARAVVKYVLLLVGLAAMAVAMIVPMPKNTQVMVFFGGLIATLGGVFFG
ncbi:MAG: hypothetical protein GXN93_00265 [Candidatus Diapherotrites archaeon]|nr:hypothetical protein [Candidatus Diapherotrites archaeon]